MDNFSGAICTFNHPSSTVLVFSNGKVISVGNRNVLDAHASIQRVCKLVQRMPGSGEANITEFAIQNIVGAGKFKQKIDYIELHRVCKPTQYWYEPELFPAVRVSLPDHNSVARVFHTGSFFITGPKTELELYSALNELYDLCEQAFKKPIQNE